MGVVKVVAYSNYLLFLKELMKLDSRASLFLEIDSRRTLSEAREQ
jgi:hypothetical protein